MERRPCPICKRDSENQGWNRENGIQYNIFHCPVHNDFRVYIATGKIQFYISEHDRAYLAMNLPALDSKFIDYFAEPAYIAFCDRRKAVSNPDWAELEEFIKNDYRICVAVTLKKLDDLELLDLQVLDNAIKGAKT